MDLNFSVVAIAFNEARTLPKLLGSLAEFLKRGGEVVIMDTGSTDDTVEVAKSLGAKVYEVGKKFSIGISRTEATEINRLFVVHPDADIIPTGERIFDFGSARNAAAELASNDMVVMPDCDEVFSGLNLDIICHYISEGVEQFEYNFVSSEDAEGRPIRQFNHVKFYHRDKMQWVGIVHEVLSGDAVKKYLPPPALQITHRQNAETNRSGYLTGLALDCFRNPNKDRNSHYFGRELMGRGYYLSAIGQLRRHVEMSNAWITERSLSQVFVGDCFAALGSRTESVIAYHMALDVDAKHRTPLMRLAWHYFQEGNAQLTACYAIAAMEIPSHGFYFDAVCDYREMPHMLLYWAYWKLNRREESKTHYDKAAEYAPLNTTIVHDRVFYYPAPHDGQEVV
jgi:hypothetical protein